MLCDCKKELEGNTARYRQVEKAHSRRFVSALKQCSKTRNIETGQRLHLDAVAAGCHTDRYVAAALINMYSKCGCMQRASEVFGSVITRDVVMWNSLLLGYVENGESSVAIEFFTKMDCEPDGFTYVAALKACAGLSSDKRFCLTKGIAIHEQLRERRLDSNIIVANTLVDMYGKCGRMQYARDVFDRMIQKSVVTWTSLIQGYVAKGESFVALELFTRMDCAPDCLTYVAALKACTALRESDKQFCLEKGLAIHEQIKDRGLLSNTVITNTLIDMYSKCGSMHRAREVFDRMTHKDVVTWTCILLGYVENGESFIAVELFVKMDCEPDCVTYVAVLKACAAVARERESEKHLCLEKGIAIHERHRDCGFDTDIVVASTLVDMYGKCGSMQRAREAFDSMISRNVITWNCLLMGYVENGEFSTSLDLFKKMDCEPDAFTYVAALKACAGLSTKDASKKQLCLEKGLAIDEIVRIRELDSDLVVTNALVDMYGKCGSMQHARDVFSRSTRRNVITWNSLLLGYVENGESSLAIDMFTKMDCEATHVTYVLVLKACGSLAAIRVGECVHAIVCRLGLEENLIVGNMLLDFYGKCGSMFMAEKLFSSMHSTGAVSWNALLAGYTSLGNSTNVLRLGKQILEDGLQMDGITFICLLTACSRAGLVGEGRTYFESMSRYGVSPSVEHYNCMVDMLGRANRLEEALTIVKSMPIEANTVTWTTLLGACRKWKNLEVGKVAYDSLVNAGTKDPAVYVLMRDIYEN